MTGRVKSLIPELESAEVYSLSELGKFLDVLPFVGLVLGILLAAVVLWVFCCFMAKEPRKNRVGLIINITLGVLLLVGLFFTLRTIELPSSMLPREQITEFGHYSREFGSILFALKCLAATGNATAAGAVSDVSTHLWLTIGLGAGMGLLAATLGVGEAMASKKRGGKYHVGIKQ